MQAHAPGTHDVQSGGRKRLSTTEFGPSKTFDVVCRRPFGPSKTFDDDEQSPSTYPSCSDATHSFHELERSRQNSAGNRGRKKRATHGKSCIHDEMLGADMPCLSAEGCAQYPCANSLHKHRAEIKPATGCLEMPHEAFRGFRGDILSILQGPLLCLEHSSRTRSILSQEHSSRTTAVPVAHAQGGALDAHTQGI